MSLFFEDLVVGAEDELGAVVFTREAIIAFAILYDPQPFHLDDEAARASIFGSLIASGWHTTSAAMRCIVDQRERVRAEHAARGEALPKLGVSPGVRALRWPAPVRPGDRIVYTSRIENLGPTRRPQWGLATIGTWGANQDGANVFSMTADVLWERRVT